MKKIIVAALRTITCMAAFFVTTGFFLWASHCIAEACLETLGPEWTSYAFKNSIFIGVQFLISGAIYLTFATASHIDANSNERLCEFFPADLNVRSFMLAIIPVISIPPLSIILTYISQNKIELNSIMHWGLLPTSLTIVVGAAAIEELLFRGLLLRMLLQYSNSSTLACLLFQSLIFALFHGEAAKASWLNFFGFVSVGLFLGVAYQASGRLWAPILLHSWLNAWSGLLVGGNRVWLAGRLFSEEMDVFMTVKRLVIIASIIFLVRMIRKTAANAEACSQKLTSGLARHSNLN